VLSNAEGERRISFAVNGIPFDFACILDVYLTNTNSEGLASRGSNIHVRAGHVSREGEGK